MPAHKITSATNPRIKNLVKLRDRKTRKETGLTIIEGVREVTRAFEGDCVLNEVYFCPGFLKSEAERILGLLSEQNVSAFEVNQSVFAKISYGDKKDGILAVGKPKRKTLESLALGQKPLMVVAEGIEKPGNLGAILRTCDGAGVDALLVCDPQTDVYNPNVIRSSLGTVFTVPVVTCTREQAVKFLKENKITVCATLPLAKKIYFAENLNHSLAIVLGSEQKGLTDFWKEHADTQVNVPMEGKADSLNVAATTAILVYEALKQRKN